ncbi:MAG: radical SAM protein [Thermoprotei archaeon]|nr:radical SAM protein [Thermoprotei archaeon]
MGVLLFNDWVVSLREDSRPRVLVIEVSTACNYSCIHCFRYGAKGFTMNCNMNPSLYERILGEAEGLGVRRLIFTGWGEPTVNPNILDFLSEAKARGFEVVLNTNGSNLEKMSKAIVDIGVDELYVSIDAFDVKLYSMIRRRGSLSAVTRGLMALSKAKSEKGSLKPVVKAIFTINKLNVNEISSIFEYARALNIVEIFLSYYIPYIGGDTTIDCVGDPECRLKVGKQLEYVGVKSIESGIKISKPNVNPSSHRSCPFASNKALYVRCDGKISPCLYYSRTWTTIVNGVPRTVREVVIGDVGEESLASIWKRHFRTLFILYLTAIPSCLDCELQNYCHLTLSNEYDCHGNSPSCAHCPYLHKLSYCPI